MARLPIPGADEGTWGDVLNDYLVTAHNADGTLKSGSVTAAHLANNAVTASKLPDNTIAEAKLDASLRAKINNGGSAGDPNLGGDLSGTASSALIVNGAVNTSKLADNAVSAAKIADNSITEPKLAISNSPSNGQVLSWNGSSLTWTAASGGGAHQHSGADITSGTIAPARLGSGTANNTTYLRGDGTWATPPSGGGGGGLTITATAQTANYTAANGDFVIGNASTAGFTVTLPAPVNGGMVSVKKVDSSVNGVIVMRSGVQIDDQTSVVLNTQWQSQDFFSDGTKWYRV